MHLRKTNLAIRALSELHMAASFVIEANADKVQSNHNYVMLPSPHGNAWLVSNFDMQLSMFAQWQLMESFSIWSEITLNTKLIICLKGWGHHIPML